MRKILLQIVAFPLLALLSACAAKRGPQYSLVDSNSFPQGKAGIIREGEFKVSVKSAGEEVEDFQTSLVHRIVLSEEIRKLSAAELPFELSLQRDFSGGLQGIKVGDKSGQEKASLAVIGLLDRDVITAIGRNMAKDVSQLSAFLKVLPHLSQEESSMTLLRRGQPHKVIFLKEK